MNLSQGLRIVLRIALIFASFVIGWIVYMLAMVLTTYDGLLSVIFQPIVAAICSAIFVTVAVLGGLLLQVPVISRWWNNSWIWAAILIACSLTVLCFGFQMGLVETYTDPETNRQSQGLSSGAALGGYFTLIFAVANWPLEGLLALLTRRNIAAKPFD